MSENQILMTQAQYPRHRDKSPQYIAKLVKAGILVMRGRMADATASDAVLHVSRQRELRPMASRRQITPRRNWPTWSFGPSCAAWNPRPARAS